MSVVEQAFRRRAAQISPHGLGLSVDVYTPDLFELVGALEQAGARADYLEIFRAAPPAVDTVRQHCASLPLECHAEGLWLTQPDWQQAYPAERELSALALQLRALGCQWMTHECAAKQMAGYSFGTYLPPLFTAAGAEVTANNVALAQARLDLEACLPHGGGPLLLLEVPPWTYFGLGDRSVPDFFRAITDRTACGLVLDIGHLWTVYRYSGAWRRQPLVKFVAEFLDAFPLERVVQIHVAGLAEHEAAVSAQGKAGGSDRFPLWIDAHGAPIPPVLFDMLEQVLAHPKLTQLKGLALEVDTKPVSMIVQEFRQFRERFGRGSHPNSCPSPGRQEQGAPVEASSSSLPGRSEEAAALRRQYEAYAQLAAGHNDDLMPMLVGEPSGLDRYRHEYLPHEILHWGGELTDMFPATYRELERADLALERFIPFWFRAPRSIDAPYDFFLLKIERFIEFVREALPDSRDIVEREAESLRGGYEVACDQMGTLTAHGEPVG
ncbi:MAG: DUF692 domain-containing protein [Nitrospira sp.]|nr:DUF692 domain-containing protein [Nitrospira sp.]